MRYNISGWAVRLAGCLHSYLWLFVLSLSCTALILTSCGRDSQPTPASAPSATSETIIERPQPLSTPEREAWQNEADAIGVPPTYWGPSPLDLRIAQSDVIVRARLRSVSQAVDVAAYLPGNLADTDYSGVLEFNLQVLEYLMGSGGSEIVAVGVEPRGFDTEEEARDTLPEIAAARDKRWDDREAIVFLQDNNDILPSTKRTGRYYLEFLTFYLDDGYTVASPHSKLWLPAASSGGASGTSGSDSQLFLTDAPSVEEGTSGASEQGAGYKTKTLGELKTRISAIKKEIEAGDGSQAYRQCVVDKYWAEWRYQWELERLGVSVVRDEKGLASGSAGGSVIYEDGDGSGKLPDKRGRYWLEGRDKDFFDVTTFGFNPYDWSGDGINDRFGYGRRIASARPLPAREYRFFFEGMWEGLVICNGYPDAQKNFYELVIDVAAPTGTVHEAFFDPVAIGVTVGANDTNGVLDPVSFNIDSVGDITIERIDWEANRVEIKLAPHGRLIGHHIDFIALDGSVALRLDFDNAASVTDDDGKQALAWGVCEQPWRAGDLLMLRISESPTDLVGVTFNADCAPSAEATPEPTATNTSEPISAP